MKRLIKMDLQVNVLSYLMHFAILAAYQFVLRDMMLDHAKPDRQGPAFFANMIIIALFIPWPWVRNKTKKDPKWIGTSTLNCLPINRLDIALFRYVNMIGLHALAAGLLIALALTGWMPIYSLGQLTAIIVICSSFTLTVLAVDFLLNDLFANRVPKMIPTILHIISMGLWLYVGRAHFTDTSTLSDQSIQIAGTALLVMLLTATVEIFTFVKNGTIKMPTLFFARD